MNYRDSATCIMLGCLIEGKPHHAAEICDKVKTEMIKLETDYKLTDIDKKIVLDIRTNLIRDVETKQFKCAKNKAERLHPKVKRIFAEAQKVSV